MSDEVTDFSEASRSADAPLSIDSLLLRIAAGERFAYLMFWGHRARADGRLSVACFSQWYPAEFSVDGLRYATAEHWMMAEKARLFGDDAALAKILAKDDPGAAKAAGRSVRGYDDAAWERSRFDAVVRGNLEKFSSHPPLREFLLATGDRVLVEASPLDPVWGIGLAADDP
jgi:ribA/ribD-fused uncharacterized protein